MLHNCSIFSRALRSLANWDDYRFFYTLAQTGSVRSSADRLAVNPSTVTRRLEGLESRLGVKLFVRSHTGLELTADGSDLYARLAPLAVDLRDLEATLSSWGDAVAGSIRLAIPDVLTIILMPEFASYTNAHPEVRLELIPDNRALDLARAEADLAIRVTDEPPEHLIGRQLGESRLGIFGSRRYLAVHDPLTDPEQVSWIESPIESVRAPGFRNRYFPRVPVRMCCHGVLLQQAAAAADLGITLLPCVLGDADERLQRIGELEALEAQPIWLLFHPDLRGAARIQSLSSHLQAVFSKLESRLLGVSTQEVNA